MIAMALSCNPEILIADEPTTALCVTVQAQILELIRKLQDEFGMGMIMITHDLGVIAEVSKELPLCMLQNCRVCCFGRNLLYLNILILLDC
jgi:peptide/nickel transport system ATP-binding protein